MKKGVFIAYILCYNTVVMIYNGKLQKEEKNRSTKEMQGNRGKH